MEASRFGRAGSRGESLLDRPDVQADRHPAGRCDGGGAFFGSGMCDAAALGLDHCFDELPAPELVGGGREPE